MIEHLVLFGLQPEVDEATLAEMVKATRVRLAEIPGVVSVRAGTNVEASSEWPFFLSVEVASMDDLEAYRVHPLHVSYVEEVIKPNTTARMAVDFETGV